MHIEFNSSAGPSLGVEMEFGLVDLTTRDLVSAASEILDVLGAPHGELGHPKAKHELFESTIEVITGICSTPAEARADLSTTIDEVQAEAARRGLGLICAGTHPFARWSDQKVTPNPRYARLVEEMAWMAERLLIFGVHFHVGVRSPQRAVAIANGLEEYLPHLLALSASSPYWDGRDTGLASCRSKVFEGLPTAGLPEPIRDWEEFELFMQTLVSAEAIGTVREVWWDIRPHPDFGTIELRMSDGIPNLDDTVALAALSQCLVVTLDKRYDRDGDVRPPLRWIVRQNKWRAARHGIEASLIIDEHGTTRPLRELIAELIAALEPTAERLGCSQELAGVTTLIDRGPSYARQRAAFARNQSLVDVVDLLLAELSTS